MKIPNDSFIRMSNLGAFHETICLISLDQFDTKAKV